MMKTGFNWQGNLNVEPAHAHAYHHDHDQLTKKPGAATKRARKPLVEFEPNRLFDITGPTSRYCPELAAEIGRDPSVLFLQLEFWIVTKGQSNNGRTGYKTTVRDIAAFLGWSLGSTHRVIELLRVKELIETEEAKPSGRWFSFRSEGVAHLHCIQMRPTASRGAEAEAEHNQAPPHRTEVEQGCPASNVEAPVEPELSSSNGLVDRQACSNLEHPRSRLEHPRSRLEHPRSRLEHPRSRLEHPHIRNARAWEEKKKLKIRCRRKTRATSNLVTTRLQAPRG